MAKTDRSFDEIASLFPQRERDILSALPSALKAEIKEIRVRRGLPLHLFLGRSHGFLRTDATLAPRPDASTLIVDSPCIDNCFKAACGYSVHTHLEALRRGFLTLPGGHRVGICGTGVLEGGEIASVRDISSLNIRVARQIKGSAKGILSAIGSPSSLLLAGVPGSGKTTVLRDIARALASGECGRYYKVTVIDERGELAAMSHGAPQHDLGVLCDVLNGYPKGEAMRLAIRSLSPDFLLCDEIGDKADALGVLESLHAGVQVIATVHAGSQKELLAREHIRMLWESGAFVHLLFLGSAAAPGMITSHRKAGEDHAEDTGNVLHYRGRRLCGEPRVQSSEPPSHTARTYTDLSGSCWHPDALLPGAAP